MVQNESKQDFMSFLEQTSVVWKTALGSAIVWELARITGSKHPYLAPLTFILCLQATIGQTLRYALYRSLGTVIGVLFIGFFATSIPVTAWALCTALLVSTTIMKLFRANDLLIHQVALSILFVLYFENHSSGYAWDRVKDTLIGAIVGVLFVIFLFPPNTIKKTEKAIQRFVQTFVRTVNLLADALQKNSVHPMKNPRELLDDLLDDVDEITATLKKVKQGTPFQIYVSNVDVERLTKQCHRVRDACVHFVTMTRSFTDDMTHEDRDQWSTRIRSLALEIPAFINGKSGFGGKSEDMSPTASTHLTTAFDPDVSEHEMGKILDALRGFTSRTKV